MWFEWTQDDKLSKTISNVKELQGKKTSTSHGKVITNVKIIIT
jgi:hypothetical protein